MSHQLRLHISGVTIDAYHVTCNEELRVTLQELPHEADTRRQMQQLQDMLTIRDGQLAALRRKSWWRRIFGGR